MKDSHIDREHLVSVIEYVLLNAKPHADAARERGETAAQYTARTTWSWAILRDGRLVRADMGRRWFDGLPKVGGEGDVFSEADMDAADVLAVEIAERLKATEGGR